ncbi:MAG: adenosine deaminase [Wujia sp.]
MDISKLPKIDLHCHLDGSFSTAYVRNTLHPEQSDEELLNMLQAPELCYDLAEYLTRFDIPISCLDSREHITAGVLDVLTGAAAENVLYMELRFAPTCSLNSSLTYKDIYEAAIEGCRIGKEKLGIDSNIIACAMRHHSIEQNLAVLKNAREFLGSGLCALDLAGDEAAFPNKGFDYLFTEAVRIGMPFTIHSGECHSVENVKYALDSGASRVGHGIALVKAPELLSDCRRKGLGLELCPTSNFQTRAVAPEEPYPLRYFLDNHLLATVNTDNRTVSNTTITKELETVCEKHGIHEEDLLTLYQNSVEISFADDNIKNELLTAINHYSWK